MHIPDGFLNTPMLIGTQIVAVSFLAPAVSRVKNTPPSRIPLMGLSGAFIFTAQMLSFPVPGGTSVHVSGAILISILLGPFTGLVISACSLIMQALLFQHGGLLSSGANLINLGVIPCLLGYALFSFMKKHIYVAAAVATLTTKLIAAMACSLELSFSGILPLKTALWSMGIAHSIGGIIEVMVTLAILGAVQANRPTLLKLDKI
jgi:cobalt/nickel transport system permease protein